MIRNALKKLVCIVGCALAGATLFSFDGLALRIYLTYPGKTTITIDVDKEKAYEIFVKDLPARAGLPNCTTFICEGCIMCPNHRLDFGLKEKIDRNEDIFIAAVPRTTARKDIFNSLSLDMLKFRNDMEILKQQAMESSREKKDLDPHINAMINRRELSKRQRINTLKTLQILTGDHVQEKSDGAYAPVAKSGWVEYSESVESKKFWTAYIGCDKDCIVWTPTTTKTNLDTLILRNQKYEKQLISADGKPNEYALIGILNKEIDVTKSLTNAAFVKCDSE